MITTEQAASARLESLSREDVRPGLLRAMVLLSFLGQAVAFVPIRQDDPFITFRYGQNLVLGHGLVFNPGERILGSTAPGHILISALVYALFGQELTPSVMSLLGCVGWTAQSVAAYFLLLTVVGKRRALVVAFALQLGAALSFKWVPFETNLVAALSLWAFVAAKHARFTLAAALAALASLVRPDALLVAALLGAVCIYEQRARALKPLAVFLALFLPWVMFATAYYGSPLPQSLLTKFHRAAVLEYFAHMVRVTGETALPYARRAPWLVPAWCAIVLGAVTLARRDRTLALLCLYAVLHAAAYLFLRPFVGHDWHLYPLQLSASLLTLGGFALLTQQARARLSRRLATEAFVVLVLAAVVRTSVMAATYRDDGWTGARHEVYLRLARYMIDHCDPGEAFASVEVGTLAYYTHLRVYDMGGMVTDIRHITGDSTVRWLVLDEHYMWMAPHWEPVHYAGNQRFKAYLFHIPEGKHLTFPRIETLVPHKR
jgi:arabinofuranosyltransferase